MRLLLFFLLVLAGAPVCAQLEAYSYFPVTTPLIEAREARNREAKISRRDVYFFEKDKNGNVAADSALASTTFYDTNGRIRCFVQYDFNTESKAWEKAMTFNYARNTEGRLENIVAYDCQDSLSFLVYFFYDSSGSNTGILHFSPKTAYSVRFTGGSKSMYKREPSYYENRFAQEFDSAGRETCIDAFANGRQPFSEWLWYDSLGRLDHIVRAVPGNSGTDHYGYNSNGAFIEPDQPETITVRDKHGLIVREENEDGVWSYHYR